MSQQVENPSGIIQTTEIVEKTNATDSTKPKRSFKPLQADHELMTTPATVNEAAPNVPSHQTKPKRPLSLMENRDIGNAEPVERSANRENIMPQSNTNAESSISRESPAEPETASTKTRILSFLKRATSFKSIAPEEVTGSQSQDLKRSSFGIFKKAEVTPLTISGGPNAINLASSPIQESNSQVSSPNGKEGPKNPNPNPSNDPNTQIQKGSFEDRLKKKIRSMDARIKQLEDTVGQLVIDNQRLQSKLFEKGVEAVDVGDLIIGNFTSGLKSDDGLDP
jgi:hypothetical protein